MRVLVRLGCWAADPYTGVSDIVFPSCLEAELTVPGFG